ncbi:MAG TPA: substrate-binding domain-containing protein [Chthoniobacteraceae bacterium]|nr:substrate-binding domain-containing protein [Chthoniobacteraceae bacterium]
MNPDSPSTTAYRPRSVQVAQYLRQMILAGDYGAKLPSERFLAAQHSVGRDTIRAALALLEEEGILASQGREGRRVRRAQAHRIAQPGSVGLLVPMKMEQTTYRTLAWVDEIRRLLFQHRVRLEVYDGYFRRPGLFRKLATDVPHDCWILAFPSPKALAWQARHQLPAVIAGTVDEEVGVPSVDIHYRALCRHAVGQLTQLGHRELVFILHRRQRGADQESILGLGEGVLAAGHPEMTLSIEYHNGSAADLCAVTDRLLQRTPRPTGWIVAVAPHFMTVMMRLLKHGVAIPGEISLISQDAEPWQSFSTPQPARYDANIRALAKQTARLVIRSLGGKPFATMAHRIIPDLIPGETLGPCPERMGSTLET